MLLLDRKEGTSIIITTKSGEQIRVTLVSKNDFGCKLGFEAHKDISILREEAVKRSKD